MGVAASGEWVSRTGRLHAVRAFIENNLAWSDLTPVTTAQALGISVRQLHLLFGPMETTFCRYVLARRLERARHVLVSEPKRKVIDIALACGIDSSTVFYRGFRDAFGMNPSAYRRAAGQPKHAYLTGVRQTFGTTAQFLESDHAVQQAGLAD